MQAEPDVRRGRSVVYSLTVHLVFVTKYRRGVITDRVRDRLRAIFTDVLNDFDADLLEMDGEDDHVHLLVSFPPKHSVATMVNSLKGVSARLLRKANLPEIRRKLWGEHFWSPSYYAGSTGGANIATVRRYIEAQRSPARRKSTAGASSRP